jgi:hypothetical protein
MIEIFKNPAKLISFIRNYSFRNIAVAPIIWSVLLPTILLDLFVSVFHYTCFPVYGIPLVSRKDYIVMDRGRLQYLKLDEKLSCIFCEYFNGLLAYVSEIAARTEQYWCPIKHLNTPKQTHRRYKIFLEHGDSDNYQQRLAVLRESFDD